jgi:hypothetical protein
VVRFQDLGSIVRTPRNFRFLFHLYNTHEFSIWNSYALVCTSTAATARNLRAFKIQGAVMKATVKIARAQGDQGKSPFSAVACLLLLLLAGILVKFAAFTPMFHAAHWN